MKYKVGDILCCLVEEVPGRARKILMGPPTEGSIVTESCFQVIAKDEIMGTYMLLIDSNMTGWIISVFHIVHLKVPAVLRGKKFWDLHEQFITKKK